MQLVVCEGGPCNLWCIIGTNFPLLQFPLILRPPGSCSGQRTPGDAGSGPASSGSSLPSHPPPSLHPVSGPSRRRAAATLPPSTRAPPPSLQGEKGVRRREAPRRPHQTPRIARRAASLAVPAVSSGTSCVHYRPFARPGRTPSSTTRWVRPTTERGTRSAAERGPRIPASPAQHTLCPRRYWVAVLRRFPLPRTAAATCTRRTSHGHLRPTQRSG